MRGLMLRISPQLPPVIIPHAIETNVTGGRLGDGLHSAFYSVLIVANSGALKEYKMTALGDYIAMAGLSQLDSLDTCQQLSSIVNMLAKNCSQRTEELTENDMAYLHGLYASRPDSNLNLQEDTIAYQMEQEAKGHWIRLSVTRPLARGLYPMLECLAPGRRRNLNRPIQVLPRGHENGLGALPDRNLLQLP
jgi:hypothetical protein